jgi:hypothetical protein
MPSSPGLCPPFHWHSLLAALASDLFGYSERATFSTPFAALAIPPEGCRYPIYCIRYKSVLSRQCRSSVHFERLMGSSNAAAMLLHGHKPNAQQGIRGQPSPNRTSLIIPNRISLLLLRALKPSTFASCLKLSPTRSCCPQPRLSPSSGSRMAERGLCLQGQPQQSTSCAIPMAVFLML